MLSVSLLRPSARVVRFWPAVCRDFWEPISFVRVRRPTIRDEFDELVRGVDESFRGMLSQVRDPTSTEHTESDTTKYELKVAVKDFKPDDIKVKVQGQNLVVEAKREEKEEKDGLFAHSFREIRRSFPLPETVDKLNLTSALSNEGILEIEAPFLPAIEEKKADDKKEIEVTHMEEDGPEETPAKDTE